MTHHSDNEIIQQILDGDTNQFELLVKKYERSLFVFVGNLIRSRQQTEDLVQDVFLAAFSRLDTFRSEKSRFSTWLHRIARNACFNALKKKREITMETLPETEHPQGSSYNPSQAVLLKESFSQLDNALESLAAQERIVFVLSEIKELSYQEIAEIESLKIGTLKSKLFRAKKKIRQCLKDYLESGETKNC